MSQWSAGPALKGSPTQQPACRSPGPHPALHRLRRVPGPSVSISSCTAPPPTMAEVRSAYRLRQSVSDWTLASRHRSPGTLARAGSRIWKWVIACGAGTTPCWGRKGTSWADLDNRPRTGARANAGTIHHREIYRPWLAPTWFPILDGIPRARSRPTVAGPLRRHASSGGTGDPAGTPGSRPQIVAVVHGGARNTAAPGSCSRHAGVPGTTLVSRTALKSRHPKSTRAISPPSSLRHRPAHRAGSHCLPPPYLVRGPRRTLPG